MTPAMRSPSTAGSSGGAQETEWSQGEWPSANGVNRQRCLQPGRPKTQADDAIAAFLAQGGVVKQMPTVATALIACSSCGYSGVVGVTAGKQGRCPRCQPLSSRGL